MNHQPHQTILFLAPLILLMFLAPYAEEYFLEEKKEGVDPIPTWSELLDEEEEEIVLKSDVDQVESDTTQSLQLDSLEIDFSRWIPDYAAHSASTLPDSLRLIGTKLAFDKLYTFFEKLESISETDTEPIEIFHWGDSQIEGDRISGLLRSSWQKSWGGSGPGLLPAYQPIPALSIRQESDENWTRYTLFGQIDSTLEHSAYGPMAAFCMVDGDAQITLKPHPSGFKLNKVWPRIKFSIGAAPLGGNITLSGVTNAYRAFSIRPASTSMHNEIIAHLEDGETELTIGFEGYKIEVTGIELGSSYGVQLHNIPMRGSAGMIFTKLDAKHFKRTIENRDVGLMILQFGGNVVPYIRDTIAAQRYGRRFAKQLAYLKGIKPNTAILVVGPSDMGDSSDDTTFPMLYSVIENLKLAAESEDCLFWDTHSVMGGRGSMLSWSESDPKLASPDLIHFTPKGARWIGKQLDHSIRAEYKSWTQWRR